MRAVPGSRLAVLAVLAFGAACAPARGPGRAPRSDRNVLTQEQMRGYDFANVFDAVQALRSNWLDVRGPTSLLTPASVWVYFDDTRLGGVESMRSVGTPSVVFARYYDGISATARWGIGHGQGVIYLSSHPH